MRMARRSMIPLSFALAATIAGCSSSGAEGDAASSRRSTEDVVYQDNARLVTDTPSAITETSVTFDVSAAASAYAVGDVITSHTGAEPYYLRKIDARREEGGKVTYTTTDAALTDLWKEAHISKTAYLEDSSPPPAPPPGATTGPKLQDVKVLPSGSRRIPFGGNKGLVQLNGGGSLDMSESGVFLDNFAVDFAYDRGSNYVAPRYVGLAVQGRITLQLGATLKVAGSVSYTAQPVEWASIPLGVVTIGAVPITVALEIESTQKVEVGGQFSLHALAGAWLQIRAGADYLEGRGVAPIWEQNSSTFHSPFDAQGEGGGSYKVYPINAKLSTRIAGVAGPYIALQPYVGAELKFTREGGAVKGLFGTEIAVGADMKVFGYRLGQVEATLLDFNTSYDGCTNTLTCTK